VLGDSIDSFGWNDAVPAAALMACSKNKKPQKESKCTVVHVELKPIQEQIFAVSVALHLSNEKLALAIPTCGPLSFAPRFL
jgi:hypothetical protein